MNIIDFFLMEQQRLHSWMRTGVSDLTVDEWHYQGAGVSNSIAFIVWHCVRTEDNILRFILQGRPPIWNLTFSHNFRGELVIESIHEKSREKKGRG
jgi:hypothetical protein